MSAQVFGRVFHRAAAIKVQIMRIGSLFGGGVRAGLLSCAFLLTAATGARTQTTTAPEKSPTATTTRENAVQILPRPKHLKETGERFALGPRTRVVLADR